MSRYIPLGPVSLSAVGFSKVIPINPGAFSTLPPSIEFAVSNGASLTATVQYTDDDITAPGYLNADGTASGGNWIALDGMAGLTANTGASLSAIVRAIRLSVTSYTSGTGILEGECLDA